jgi:hypothetical protein
MGSPLKSKEADVRSPTRLVRGTGLLYLVIFALGIFAELFVRQNLIVPGDAAATASNIVASESLYRLALLSDLIRHVLLILLPLALFGLLGSVHRGVAWLMAALALVSVPISMINMLNHFAALVLITQAPYLTAFGTDQLQGAAMFFLELYDRGAFVGQILGLWLLPLGYLVFRSRFLPRVFGILLEIGGLCYVTDVVIFILLPGTNLGLSLLAFVSELLFALWLLIRGVDSAAWDRVASAST